MIFSERRMGDDVEDWLVVLRELVEKVWGAKPGACRAAFGKRWRHACVAGSGEMSIKDGKD